MAKNEGTASQAIEWALDCEDDLYNMQAFLTAWREGTLATSGEWDDYLKRVEEGTI